MSCRHVNIIREFSSVEIPHRRVPELFNLLQFAGLIMDGVEVNFEFWMYENLNNLYVQWV